MGGLGERATEVGRHRCEGVDGEGRLDCRLSVKTEIHSCRMVTKEGGGEEAMTCTLRMHGDSLRERLTNTLRDADPDLH